MTGPRVAVTLLHGAASHVGLVRSVNEDACSVRPGRYVVADGMGGHQGGAVASGIVVEEFDRLPDALLDLRAGTDLLSAALVRSQGRVRDWSSTQAQPGAHHAGTTVVAVLLCEGPDGPVWLVANLGDSRAYRLHHAILDQLTRDHSVVQALLDAGQVTPAEAATHPERHVITRALGTSEGVDPDFFLAPVQPGDRVLLCSDGINGMVGDEVIAEILSTVTGAQGAAEALVEAALAAGGRDNATAVVVDVVGWRPEDHESEQPRADDEPNPEAPS